MAIQHELLTYTVDDLEYEGFLAWDDSKTEPGPGILVGHAWGGRNEFFDANAIRLARAGYVGFAWDVYGKGVRGGTPEENAALMQPLKDDRLQLQKILIAALETLAGQPQVDQNKLAAMGFCFGGLCVLDLARINAKLRGVVSLHGLLDAPPDGNQAKSDVKVLALHGWDDPMVPPEAVTEFARECTAAGIDWQLHAYGQTKHGFAVPGPGNPDLGVVYNKTAERRALRSAAMFFRELFADEER